MPAQIVGDKQLLSGMFFSKQIDHSAGVTAQLDLHTRDAAVGHGCGGLCEVCVCLRTVKRSLCKGVRDRVSTCKFV